MTKLEYSKEDWHYRFTNTFYWEFFACPIPKDFCTYWRNFVYAIFFTCLLLAMTAFIVFGLGYGLYSALQNPLDAGLLVLGVTTFVAVLVTFAFFIAWTVDKWKTYHERSLEILINILGFICLILLSPVLIPMFIIGYLIVNIKNFLSSEEVKEEKKKQPGLVKTKYKSWKEQYCPMIEIK